MRQITSFVLAYVLFAVWTFAPINECLSLNSRNYFVDGIALAKDSLDLDCSSDENKDGGKCQSTNLQYEDGGYNTATMWLSFITVVVAMFVMGMIIGYCTTSSAGQPSCGWSTVIAATGAVALLAGEVISNIIYKDTVKKIEFNPSLIRKYKDKCEGNPEEVANIVGSDGIKICDQFDSLRAQRESYEAMLTALNWKIGLFIAGGAMLAIAAIMEFVAAWKTKAKAGGVSTASKSAVPGIAAEVTTRTNPTPAMAAAIAVCNGACTTAITQSGVSFLIMMTEYFADIGVVGSDIDARKYSAQIGTIAGAVEVACRPGILACPAAPEAVIEAYRLFRFNFLCEIPNPSMTCDAAYWDSYRNATTYHEQIPLDKGEVNYVANLLAFIMPEVWAEDKRDTSSSNLARGSFADWLPLIGGAWTGLVIALINVNKEIAHKLYAKNWARGLWYLLLDAAVGTTIGMMFAAKGEIQEHIDRLDAILNSVSGESDGLEVSDSDIDYSGIANFMDSQGDQDLPPDSPPFPCPAGGDGKGNCLDPSSGNGYSLQTLGLDSLAGLAGSANTFGKSIGGKKGLNKDARMAAGNLIRNAAKLKKMRDSFLKKLKDDLANSGYGLNLDNEQKRISGMMNKAITDTLKKNGVTPQQLLSGMNVNTGDPEKAPIAAASVFPNAETGAVLSAEQSGFDFQLPTEENTAAFDDGMSGLEELNINAGEIAQNSNGNIFQMITTRYMKTAYPIIFDEQATIAPTTEAPAAPAAKGKTKK